MTTPYLGSKISLISKSEIRYEGILYTIDTRESTIALAQVRSFGTENRPAEKFVAPREEVYEYIIFRAHDIKDLIVDDPPPAPSSITQALGDPAIIQAQSSMPTSSSTFTKPSLSAGAPSTGINGSNTTITVGSTSTIAPPTSRPVGNITNMPVFTNASAGSQSSVTSGPPAAGPAFGGATASSMGFRSGGSSPTAGHRRSPVSDSGAPKNRESNRDDKAPKNHVMNNRDNRNQNYRDNNYRGNSDNYRGNGGDRRQGPPQFGRRPMPGQEPPPPPRNMNFRGRGRQGPPPPPPPLMPKMNRGPMMNRAPPQPRTQYNRGPVNRNAKPTTSLKIEDDYDFEKANKEFEELESKLSKVKIENEPEKKEVDEVKEESEESTPVKDGEKKEDDEENVFYDKTKSFFDKISCEALERSKGKVNRIDWRQERKMNAETFGLTANNFRRGGYRGRGGYQGGYSGYSRQNYNSNRNFNQRLGGRNNYGSGSNDRRVNQPRETTW